MRPTSVSMMALLSAAAPVWAVTPHVTVDHGIEFVTVGGPGNHAYDGEDHDPIYNALNIGRGSVPYAYRMGQTEVTTAQWLELVNTFSQRADDPYRFYQVRGSGMVRDYSYPGPGQRYVLDPDDPNAGMRPVFGIQWRQAAMYCNWLCNDKGTTDAAIANGAYDTSTFGFAPNPDDPDGPMVMTDQLAHNPDARFWIPTLDEWIKAVHYDPDKRGEGQGGWWLYPNASDDTPLISGLPGIGETSAGYFDPDEAHLRIPLGAYPDQLTPWGLLDASGGASEWLEDRGFGSSYRRIDGSYADEDEIYARRDMVGSTNSIPIIGNSHSGLRIAAAAIPTPATAWYFAIGTWAILRVQGRRK